MGGEGRASGGGGWGRASERARGWKVGGVLRGGVVRWLARERRAGAQIIFCLPFLALCLPFLVRYMPVTPAVPAASREQVLSPPSLVPLTHFRHSFQPPHLST